MLHVWNDDIQPSLIITVQTVLFSERTTIKQNAFLYKNYHSLLFEMHMAFQIKYVSSLSPMLLFQPSNLRRKWFVVVEPAERAYVCYRADVFTQRSANICTHSSRNQL